MDSDSLLCTRITLCSRNDYLGNYVQNLGISNTDIALYTSWLYLPWVIKPFWSPFVDLLKTKRWWIVSMQLLVGAGLAGIAFTIPMSNFFQTTLAIFG